jgi:3-hydroxyacyl-[acyl-carrier-protein] dehydratase
MGSEGHFRAFTFVDRIDLLEPDRRIRGNYRIPEGIDGFPTALAAEAVGQLAAWAAMFAVHFESRPVAGLAAEIEFFSAVRPGQLLELDVELASVDTEAVSYHGTASADNLPVAHLRHCVGPMIPVEELDDPQALRARFELLRGPGAEPGAFRGIRPLELDCWNGDSQSARATLHVPESAPFFCDHFPRRPVLPGVLLMQSKLELVSVLAEKLPAPAPGARWVPRVLSDVKLRAFAAPGEVLDIEARLGQLSADAAVVTVETRKGKRVVGGSRVRLVLEGPR